MSTLGRLKKRRVEIITVADAVLKACSDTEMPQGLIAVLPFPQLPIPSDPKMILIADSLRDPGNLGTLLRSAAASDVDAVLLPALGPVPGAGLAQARERALQGPGAGLLGPGLALRRPAPQARLERRLADLLGKGWMCRSLSRLSLFKASLHACGGGFASGLCIDGCLLCGLLLSGSLLLGQEVLGSWNTMPS